MPRHRVSARSPSDDALVREVLKQLRETPGSDVECDSFEENLLRKLTQVRDEVLADHAKARAGRSTKKTGRKR